MLYSCFYINCLFVANLRWIKETYMNSINITNMGIFALYGTWEALVGCKMLPQAVGTFSILGDICLIDHIFVFPRSLSRARGVAICHTQSPSKPKVATGFVICCIVAFI